MHLFEFFYFFFVFCFLFFLFYLFFYLILPPTYSKISNYFHFSLFSKRQVYKFSSFLFSIITKHPTPSQRGHEQGFMLLMVGGGGGGGGGGGVDRKDTIKKWMFCLLCDKQKSKKGKI